MPRTTKATVCEPKGVASLPQLSSPPPGSHPKNERGEGLAVAGGDVGDAGDRGEAVEGAVGSVVVVEVQPRG
jgi:hypothetical protein